MTELLKRWASLEPERCRVSDAAAHLRSPFAFRIHWATLTADPINLAVVLAAVIEAIEARGWRFVLVHSPWRTHRLAWEAYISRYEEGDLELARRDHDARTPAEAVLSAYLAALEAEAGQ